MGISVETDRTDLSESFTEFALPITKRQMAFSILQLPKGKKLLFRTSTLFSDNFFPRSPFINSSLIRYFYLDLCHEYLI
jgi:hypothetical protein